LSEPPDGGVVAQIWNGFQPPALSHVLNEETSEQSFSARVDLRNKGRETKMTTAEQNVKTLLETFDAIEQRDERRFRELVDPAFESHWPPCLPYGGTARGLEPPLGRVRWSDTWAPLQPTTAERRMEPRVVGASGDEVVALYRQRGVNPSGVRFDGEVLGLYQFREGKLARAQMFYFDTVALADFLTKAAAPDQQQRAHVAFDGLKSLSDDRRRTVQRAYEDLRELPRTRQQRTLEAVEYTNIFSRGELDLLSELLALNLRREKDDSKGQVPVQDQ
jgi:ketosteroid isomerase-like protein